MGDFTHVPKLGSPGPPHLPRAGQPLLGGERLFCLSDQLRITRCYHSALESIRPSAGPHGPGGLATGHVAEVTWKKQQLNNPQPQNLKTLDPWNPGTPQP